MKNGCGPICGCCVLSDSTPASAAVAPQAPLPEALLTQGIELAGSTVALDSRIVSAALDPNWAKQGVLFGSLDALVAEHGDKIRPHLFRAVDPNYDKFAALHAACWSGGSLLYVPRGVKIDRPFHTLSAIAPRGVDLGHILVVLEEGAEATLPFPKRPAAPLPMGPTPATPCIAAASNCSSAPGLGSVM